MKQERIKIIIDENGDPSIDILKAVGPSCQKDAEDWAKLAGGGAKVTKKPEFYRQAKKAENTNIQTGG
jgi:hypothetical protein